jgi:UDP-GlcNAc:undecaprenyl-phosphate GlcNAc-1-phosphate transferase
MRFITGAGEFLPYVAAALVVAGLLAFFLTPLVRRLAVRYGVIDRPNHRRVNESPVPRGGGLAVVAAFVIVAGAFIVLDRDGDLVPMPTFVGVPEIAALLGGGILAAFVGALDDWFDLRARWQLLGQVAVALVAVALGISVGFVSNPFGDGNIVFGDAFARFFTVLWIVGMINSINFIDGLDGLSSGIGLIAAVALGLISLTTQVGQPFVAVLCFALAGALAGFLRWNFHPATIFSGTTGVMFLGYTLAILSILGTAKVAVALLVLGVPIIDTFWTMVRRLATGRSPFTPDRGHLHHRLLDLGLSHTQTVVLIYGICAALGLMTFVLSPQRQLYAFLGLGLLAGLGLFVMTRGEFAEEALEAESYEDRRGASPGG